jgi:hypothetical protein
MATFIFSLFKAKQQINIHRNMKTYRVQQYAHSKLECWLTDYFELVYIQLIFADGTLTSVMRMELCK